MFNRTNLKLIDHKRNKAFTNRKVNNVSKMDN